MCGVHHPPSDPEGRWALAPDGPDALAGGEPHKRQRRAAGEGGCAAPGGWETRGRAAPGRAAAVPGVNSPSRGPAAGGARGRRPSPLPLEREGRDCADFTVCAQLKGREWSLPRGSFQGGRGRDSPAFRAHEAFVRRAGRRPAPRRLPSPCKRAGISGPRARPRLGTRVRPPGDAERICHRGLAAPRAIHFGGEPPGRQGARGGPPACVANKSPARSSAQRARGGGHCRAGEEAPGPGEVTLPGCSISDGGESGSERAGGT